MHELLESPAVSFVGRHNSGKTTIICEVIAELTRRGLDVGSIKHHGHAGFSIDVPGKDSFRHRESGATETVIVAPDAVARIRDIDEEVECGQILATMPGHDIVIVEGYRASGVPMIEVMRQKSHRDLEAASQLLEFGFDSPAFRACDGRIDVDATTVAVTSDIPAVLQLAESSGRRTFELPEMGTPVYGKFISDVCDFIQENYSRERVTLAIQAGGESRRMGQSKALIEFNGEPMIARLVGRLQGAADEIVITTNEPEKLEFLYDEFPDVPLRLAPDVYEERGALAGFVTAFEAASYDTVAMVACDLPLASANLIASEASLLRQSGADAVAPCNSHGFETMHAVYRKSACASVAKELVEQGDMRCHDLIHAVNVREMTQDEVRLVVPLGACFANVNTPNELENLSRHALRQGE